MKLSPVLAQFLFTNKYLQLAGIGRFIIEDAFPVEAEKSQKGNEYYKIKFEQDQTLKEDKELISFVSVQTGKMKSLAASDLDSYLELIKQFLNIGKPFLFEGIGTLSKNRSGQYDFIPGQQLNEKLRNEAPKEYDQTSTTENSFTDYEEMFSPKKPKTSGGRKITIVLAILAGIALAVWGGYVVNNRNKNKENKSEPIAITDTARNLKDSIRDIQPTINSGTYKYIIEKAGKERALARFNYLKKWGIDIKMETTDSVTFKLFFTLASQPADTLRIRDSLGALYSSRGPAYIEQ